MSVLFFHLLLSLQKHRTIVGGSSQGTYTVSLFSSSLLSADSFLAHAATHPNRSRPGWALHLTALLVATTVAHGSITETTHPADAEANLARGEAVTTTMTREVLEVVVTMTTIDTRLRLREAASPRRKLRRERLRRQHRLRTATRTTGQRTTKMHTVEAESMPKRKHLASRPLSRQRLLLVSSHGH